jgi:hypothetical protein
VLLRQLIDALVLLGITRRVIAQEIALGVVEV